MILDYIGSGANGHAWHCSCPWIGLIVNGAVAIVLEYSPAKSDCDTCLGLALRVLQTIVFDRGSKWQAIVPDGAMKAPYTNIFKLLLRAWLALVSLILKS